MSKTTIHSSAREEPRAARLILEVYHSRALPRLWNQACIKFSLLFLSEPSVFDSNGKVSERGEAGDHVGVWYRAVEG